MNGTTAKFLNGIENSRVKLAEILNNRNVEAESGEPLEDLVEKTARIHGGVEFGEWVPTVNTDIFTIGGLEFLPYKIGLSCEALFGQTFYGNAVNNYVSLFSANSGEGTDSIYIGNQSELKFGNVPPKSTVTVTQESDGSYTVKVDFSNYNLTSGVPYYFKSGYKYMWVTATKEWSL
ncbi:MAG: hypothetical protein J6J13_00035 [Clostridia bacterium]|nr:hypothetical protein [Clostridia bacterium]